MASSWCRFGGTINRMHFIQNPAMSYVFIYSSYLFFFKTWFLCNKPTRVYWQAVILIAVGKDRERLETDHRRHGIFAMNKLTHHHLRQHLWVFLPPFLSHHHHHLWSISKVCAWQKINSNPNASLVWKYKWKVERTRLISYLFVNSLQSLPIAYIHVALWFLLWSG